MRIYLSLSLTLFLPLLSCHSPNPEAQLEQWTAEIVAVEKAFNDMAQADGLAKAFQFYAAEEGVLKRGQAIIKGKEAIGQFYTDNARPNSTLTWAPTFVDVSESGDLAYTYGDFTFTFPDSLGNLQESTGIFHTVWKRQADGNWRFVWD